MRADMAFHLRSAVLAATARFDRVAAKQWPATILAVQLTNHLVTVTVISSLFRSDITVQSSSSATRSSSVWLLFLTDNH